MTTTHVLADIEAKVVAGQPVSREDIQRLCGCTDLISVGVTGEQARRALSGDRVTFNRVLEVGEQVPAGPHGAGEIRLIGAPATVADALARIRAVATWAGGRPVTGFALADLAVLAGHDIAQLTDLASALRGEGLEAVASVPLDRAASDADLIAQVQAVLAGGLGAWRLTVEQAADLAIRQALIERAQAVQDATGAVRAFAPLPTLDPSDTPSTGYDDVRTIAAARVRCRTIAHVQVDWALYGPKLAQVAIAFGANDIDGVSAVETPELGPRRAPVEDIVRQIRAAGGAPVERNGRFEGV